MPDPLRGDERQPEPPLRADAERNRARIVQTARRLFATEGLDVSLASIARHFASREDLIAAVFVDTMDGYIAITDEALRDPDPWHGFISYIHEVCRLQASDRGFAVVLSSAFPTARALEAKRAEAYQGFLQLIASAKATGHLREDFASEDLVLLMMANAGLIAVTAEHAPDSWRRFAGQMQRAFASPGAPLPTLPPAPSSDDLYRAMGRSG
jgi:AcrR family transcriptional regulator